MQPEAPHTRGIIAAVCASDPPGEAKVARERVELVRGIGIRGDAHSGSGHRQVRLLAEEGLAPLGVGAREKAPGSFGESFRTCGFDFNALAEGRRVRVGDHAVLQVTECARPPVGDGFQAGDAFALTWIFARVVRSGAVTHGDVIATDGALDRPRFAVVTLSDRCAAGEARDESGVLAATLLGEALGAPALAYDILPDDAERLAERLTALADDEICDLIVTTGGTGLSPRDVTPEGTRSVIDREVPGIAEAIRAGGLAKTPLAMLSRAVCGQRGSTLIVNLSGSPKAVREQLAILLPVLPHILVTASGVPQNCGRIDLDTGR